MKKGNISLVCLRCRVTWNYFTPFSVSMILTFILDCVQRSLRNLCFEVYMLFNTHTNYVYHNSVGIFPPLLDKLSLSHSNFPFLKKAYWLLFWSPLCCSFLFTRNCFPVSTIQSGNVKVCHRIGLISVTLEVPFLIPLLIIENSQFLARVVPEIKEKQ